MLVELGLVEQRHKAVLEVLDGATVTDVARRYGVSRQSVHAWLGLYSNHGLAGLADRSSRPDGCPHQMLPALEATVVEMRVAHQAPAAPGGLPALGAVPLDGVVANGCGGPVPSR
jgi:hypothetical protein